MRSDRSRIGWRVVGVIFVVALLAFVSKWAAAIFGALLVVGLLRRSEPPAPEVKITPEGVSVEARGERQGLPWTELVEVFIVTTSDGPFAEDVFWVLIGTEHRCVVPGAQGQALLDHLGRLPRFDFEQVIAAMGSTDDARFRCWAGQPGEGLAAAVQPA